MQDDEINNLNTLLKFAELQKNLRGVNIDDTSQKRWNRSNFKPSINQQRKLWIILHIKLLLSPITPGDFDLQTFGYMALCRPTGTQRIRTRTRMYPTDKTYETVKAAKRRTDSGGNLSETCSNFPKAPTTQRQHKYSKHNQLQVLGWSCSAQGRDRPSRRAESSIKSLCRQTNNYC